MADESRDDATGASAHASGRGEVRITPTDRYGIVLALLFATFFFMASASSGPAARVTTVVLQALTLLAAASAAGAKRRVIRIVLLVAVAALIVAVGSVFINTNRDGDGVFFALNVLLVAAAPFMIARSIWRHRVIDLQTVLGAICIYVLLGLMAAFVYGAIADLSSTAFFAQQQHATSADYVYFSFVTLTTVGYGDLTAAHNLGRAIAALEGMLGQLYLVTVVAVTVGRLGRGRADQVPTS